MATTTNKKKEAAKKSHKAKGTGKPKERPGAKARAIAMKKILLNVEKKMAAENLKATLGDYMRLVQLQREMVGETATDITVMWVDPPAEDLPEK